MFAIIFSEVCERQAARWIENNLATARQGKLTPKQKKHLAATSWWPSRKAVQKNMKAVKKMKVMKVMKARRW